MNSENLTWDRVATTSQKENLIKQVTGEVGELKSSTALSQLINPDMLIAGSAVYCVDDNNKHQLRIDRKGVIRHLASRRECQMDDTYDWVDEKPQVVDDRALAWAIELYRINPGDINAIQKKIES